MRALILAFALLAPAAVAAQDMAPVDQSKTYGSREDCDFGDGEGLVLDFSKGIEGVEYHCDFFEVKSSPNSIFLLVEAVCEAPGIRNPDLLSIAPADETSIEVVSLYDSAMIEATDEYPNPGTTIYHVCK